MVIFVTQTVYSTQKRKRKELSLIHADNLTQAPSRACSYDIIRSSVDHHFIAQGLKKADQQTILDDFDKCGSGISESRVATLASLAVIASRTDVLTRATAPGRGATTTRFKRFLASTEATKDWKDRPLRKLFNA